MGDPAGWYSQSDGRKRFWDGQQWTTPGVTTARRPEFRARIANRYPLAGLIVAASLVGITGFAVSRGAVATQPGAWPVTATPDLVAAPNPVTTKSGSPPLTATP